ncbi:AAA family ATPase [Priestia megaterium]|uniref:AAA family ATPase n=1 Tax=Priestia megaterium TaxID=1404 RepID=UPI0039C0F884
MKLQRITLNNIKKFNGTSTFDFSKSKEINTISGKNGAGKTTVFNSLVLAQKAFFINLIMTRDHTSELYEEVGKELFVLMNDKNSYIEIFFKINQKEIISVGVQDFINNQVAAAIEETEVGIKEDEIYIEVSFKLKVNKIILERVFWEIEIDESNNMLIQEFWNLQNPRRIITFIESNKNIIEGDVTYSNIELKPESTDISPMIDLIINYKNSFKQLYRQLINDYVYERLIPANRGASTIRKDISMQATKVLFKNLMPHLDIKNFSGTKRDQQFILTASTNTSNKKNSLFDMRNFSSGEKFLWYLLLYINYIKNTGILIIDEPENHLHEELVCKLAGLLKDISLVDSYPEFILNLGLDSDIFKKGKTENLDKYLSAAYECFELNQVFLLTHSKSLIYSNFTVGTNYVVDQKLMEITYDECEHTLRDIGISYVNDKVLFVEGIKDLGRISGMLGEYNIKIQELGSCEQVIKTFLAVSKVKKFIRESQFVFLIDRDTRDESDINSLRNNFPEAFDKYFIVMEKHELENYLLVPTIFHKVLKAQENSYSSYNAPSKEEIEKRMFKNASLQLNNTKQLYASQKIIKKIEVLKRGTDKNFIEFGSLQAYQDSINSKFFEGETFIAIKEEILNLYEEVEKKYNEAYWKKNWLDLCEGKMVFNKTVGELCRDAGLINKRLEEEIFTCIINDSSSQLYKLNKQILEKFQISNIN